MWHERRNEFNPICVCHLSCHGHPWTILNRNIIPCTCSEFFFSIAPLRRMLGATTASQMFSQINIGPLLSLRIKTILTHIKNTSASSTLQFQWHVPVLRQQFLLRGKRMHPTCTATLRRHQPVIRQQILVRCKGMQRTCTATLVQLIAFLHTSQTVRIASVVAAWWVDPEGLTKDTGTKYLLPNLWAKI